MRKRSNSYPPATAVSQCLNSLASKLAYELEPADDKVIVIYHTTAPNGVKVVINTGPLNGDTHASSTIISIHPLVKAQTFF